MTRSMTGFGQADGTFLADAVSVEVSAVNHRYLDCFVRLPNGWSALEHEVRDAVKKRLARGKVSVIVSRKRGQQSRHQVMFDATLAEQYIDAGKHLSEMMGINQQLTADTVAQFDGVFSQEEPEEDLDEARRTVNSLVGQALDRLDGARAAEGDALCLEIEKRVDLINAAVDRVKDRLPEVQAASEKKLRERIMALAEDVNITEERLTVELGILAEKGDVTEEVVRLDTHLGRMRELARQDEPVGREMNFLSQEIQREINTLGAKVRDTDVVNETLTMKAEIEKIREQIQNIE